MSHVLMFFIGFNRGRLKDWAEFVRHIFHEIRFCCCCNGWVSRWQAFVAFFFLLVIVKFVCTNTTKMKIVGINVPIKIMILTYKQRTYMTNQASNEKGLNWWRLSKWATSLWFSFFFVLFQRMMEHRPCVTLRISSWHRLESFCVCHLFIDGFKNCLGIIVSLFLHFFSTGCRCVCMCVFVCVCHAFVSFVIVVKYKRTIFYTGEQNTNNWKRKIHSTYSYIVYFDCYVFFFLLVVSLQISELPQAINIQKSLYTSLTTDTLK